MRTAEYQHDPVIFMDNRIYDEQWCRNVPGLLNILRRPWHFLSVTDLSGLMGYYYDIPQGRKKDMGGKRGMFLYMSCQRAGVCLMHDKAIQTVGDEAVVIAYTRQEC